MVDRYQGLHRLVIIEYKMKKQYLDLLAKQIHQREEK